MKLERGLSINQPWAWLITAGFKVVDNRSWTTSYRGRILLHASATQAKLAPTRPFVTRAHPTIAQQLNELLPPRKPPLLPFGQAVGIAEMVGVVSYSPDVDESFAHCCEEQGYGAWYAQQVQANPIAPDYFASGSECFLLANVVRFAKPFMMKGRLSLFQLTPAEISAASAAAKQAVER